MIETLRRSLEGKKEEMRGLLQRLVNIDSGSRCKAGVDACADLLAEELARLDFEVKIIREVDCGNQAGLDTPPIAVFLCGDEELGSIRGRPHIEEEAKRSACVLVVEAAVPPVTVVTRRWGVGAYELSIQGHAAHVLDSQVQGRNACRELAFKVLALEALSDPERGTKVSVNVVQGGSARQVTAGHAWAEVDVRVRDLQAAQGIERALREAAETPTISGMVNHLTGQMTRPPMQPNAGTQALLAVAEGVGKEVGVPVAAGQKAGGSDGSFSAALGIATLGGLGPLGRDMCTEEERIEEASLVSRSLLLARLIQRLAQLDVRLGLTSHSTPT